MPPRRPAGWAEDQPGKQQPHGRANDQELAMDLRDHFGDDRRPDHPSYDARDAEKQDEGEEQFARGVAGQLIKS